MPLDPDLMGKRAKPVPVEKEQSLVDSALSWLERGIVPVPLRPKSKAPAIAWSWLRDRPPPPALVRRWFVDDPARNLGLICGPVSGNLVVLDFDRPLHYHRWCRAYARQSIGRSTLSFTYTVRTRRGYHVYLRLADPPSSSCPMVGGDVKASGYVVAAGSIHPSGFLYHALDPLSPILLVHDLGMAGVEVPVLPPTERKPAPPSPERSGSFVDAVKEAMPLPLYLQRITRLYPSSPDGAWFMAQCPLHDDRHPSMWVNVHAGVCRCFRSDCPGSRRVMDVINLHATLHNLSNEEALLDLASLLAL